MNLRANLGKVLSILAAIAAVAVVSISIWLNPPSENRARALDQKRLDGMKRTESAICDYFKSHHALPADLKALDSERNQSIQASWHDPETQQPLEYTVTGQDTYRLCATFDRSSDWQNSDEYGFKKHSAGRDCLDYTASRDKD